ncbi:hypothetical protein Mp_6g12040 [Marchantia polymorpha subsp. ruderalis]|nr:hypothetical protein MARPO_0135s0032 [Marchantia polymorpha]BBN14475.1 hypothetical protein Mp_6g12040 [Marchantia polymorpha subsp. ruderalis]|eukprot:PTQ29749.1 hypothetical protein MARPO_0135s0032 [Marchantia polymorpha]
MAFKGKVAVVTGGSRGIGREVCFNLAREGASVAVGYQGNAEAANEVVSQIAATQGCGRAIAVRVDVVSAADVKEFFSKANEEFGRIDFAINMAGTLLSNYPKIEDTTEEEWDRVFAINTKGTFLVCKEAQKWLGPGGRIVTCSSNSVGALLPKYGSYIASKAAVEAFSRVLAKEMAGKGITVNCIAPGPTATDMFYAGKSQEWIDSFIRSCPMGRLGEVQDIAPLVRFLVSPEAEWVNGQVIRANGGTG